MHHSLADGVAIVNLLATPTDKDDVDGNDQQRDKHCNEKAGLQMPLLQSFTTALELIFIQLPQIIMQRANQPDCNSLHCNRSSARNFTNWYFEEGGDNDTVRGGDVGLLHKIKTIKALESGLTFQDVLCTSLSVTMYQHFAAKSNSNNNNNNDNDESCTVQMTEEEVTIGNAVQLRAGDQRTLTNNCAYNFERIPLGRPAVNRDDLLTTLREIRQRRAEVGELQKVNYMIIKICSLLPQYYLRKVLTKDRCSLGVSNIPGPDTTTSGEFRMRHLTFWTPNRFKTRLGLSVFSLGNKLHLGLGGDRCSFGDDVESGQFLEAIVENINRMYKLVKEH